MHNQHTSIQVVLSSGEKPWKLVNLKAKLQSVWKLNYVWRLISLGMGYFQIMLNSDADKNMEYWHPKIIFDLARGIGVPLQLDRATMEGDFGHFAHVLVDIDVSTVPPSSLLLERDDSHSSFISMEYENLPAFCSTCSSIGHFPYVCHWNKSGKGIPVSYSKSELDRNGPATIVADEGFQVLRNCAPKMVFRPISGPQTEVLVSNIFTTIQQDLGSLNSDVVHSSEGSDPVLSMVSSTCLVASPSFTTSVVAAQAELCLIDDSSWASQTEAKGLDASNISQRTTMITHRMMKLKSKMRTSSGVSDD
ncbi:hypothetical protein Dsin_016263 [Dipteronia sinensis]|uniref:Uncharacterized protein n=1 Tax=Dipteronia sinensis TaxID=43782 RepID=A0AAE0ADZ1_9ROSI|nr:hypothetical protein Dsin_016263 [Dipteronia sinensis]